MHSQDNKVRFTRANPCPICSGFDQVPRGKGVRCFGFGQGDRAHCTREEHAGRAEFNERSETYAHKLYGACTCGVEHRPAPPRQSGRQKRRIIETYDYEDKNGQPLYQVVRFAPKGFAQRRPDGNGNWIWNKRGVRRVPYRLPELVGDPADAEVYVPEGEADVERLRSLELCATCNDGGAGKWDPDFGRYFTGRRVIVLPDNDEKGRNHADHVAGSLLTVAESVKVLQLPDLPDKGDVSDWVKTGGTRQRLQELALDAPEYEPAAPIRSNGATPIEDQWPGYAYMLTDMGNGQRLARRHGRDLRHCLYLEHPWHAWDGHRWVPNDIGQVERWAKLTTLSIYGEAEKVVGEDGEAQAKRDAIVKWAKTSQTASRLNAMMALARSEPGIPILPDDLDRDAWLLNVANATIDLRTGQAREQRREELLTKICLTDYDPNATCPLWIAFPERIFAGNMALTGFIKRAVGYSLTGESSEQVILILHGTGANGKTTFLGTITALMGGYAQWTEFSTFLLKDRDAIRNDLAALKGARLVSAAESQQGRRLDETVVKMVAGGDKIRARFLHREFFEYQPQFKVWLATNHKPEIRGTDHAIWRRIRLVPFSVTIADQEQDRELPAKLKAELPGILNWALHGLADWRENGLGYPEEVRSATEEYRLDQDYLGDFLAEAIIDEPVAYVTHKELFLAYRQWCEENHEKPLGSKRFSQIMVERGYERGKFGPNSHRGFAGLTMRPGRPLPQEGS